MNPAGKHSLRCPATIATGKSKTHPLAQGSLLLRLLAMSLALLSVTGLRAAEFQANSQLAENWIEKVYQPAFQQFATSASDWASDTEDLCESPLGSRIYGLQTRFTQLLADYARVEVFRSGPLLHNNTQNKLFYWPDKRRAGERQLRALLADPDVNELSVEQLAAKSVAVQGFPALERLLFSRSYQAVETKPQCHVVQLIIRNIADMARQLESGWQNDASFVQAFVHPDPSSPDFRNEDEVLRSVITEVVTGLDMLIDRKLQTLTSDDPRVISTAPLWLSRRTIAMLKGNVAGIRALLFDSGMLAQMELEEAFRLDFDYVDHLLSRVQYRYTFAYENGRLTEEFDTTFRSVAAVLDVIRLAVNNEVLVPLGMGVNFNADDGD